MGLKPRAKTTMTPMDVIVARIRADGDQLMFRWPSLLDQDESQYKKPQPLEDANKLRLPPNGAAMPADLTTWLQYTSSWPPLLDRGTAEAASLLAMPLRETLTQWASDSEVVEEFLEDEVEEFGLASEEDIVNWWIGLLPSRDLADVYAVLLPSGDQECLLMLEEGRDELRVLGCHKFIEFWWKYKTFGEYLRHWFWGEEP